jgi:histidine kinase
VVVIDRELNLVAWNSRYLELFRFPPDLVRVGRPIEDLLRFNAAAACWARPGR